MRVGGESRVRNQQSLSADHWSRKKMIRGEVGGMGTSTGTPDGVGKPKQGCFVAAVRGTTSAQCLTWYSLQVVFTLIPRGGAIFLVAELGRKK